MSRIPGSTLTLKHWPFDDTTEWLTPVDLLLCQAAVGTLAAARTDPVAICEIGVWKGAWTQAILRGEGNCRVTGIDPYPNLESVRDETLGRIEVAGLGSRFALKPSHEAFCSSYCNAEDHAALDVVHIDGEHTESAAEADLRFAAQHLSTEGIAIVDDFRHPYYPGVASALFGALRELDLAAFLVTSGKAYLTRREAHSAWNSRIKEILAGTNLIWQRHRYDDGTPPYLQLPTIQGFEVVLCVAQENSELALRGVPRPPRLVWRARLNDWTPPAVKRGIRKVSG